LRTSLIVIVPAGHFIPSAIYLSKSITVLWFVRT